MPRHIVIAQGGGFYGCAFFTTEHHLGKLRMALEEEPGFRISCEHKQISLMYPPDTCVLIHPWEGKAQPNPVVLFDTGHSAVDLHILEHIRHILNRPYMTNGNLEKNYLERMNGPIKVRPKLKVLKGGKYDDND